MAPLMLMRCRCALLVGLAVAFGACATPPPKRPQQFRPDVVKASGPASSTPVALMATYKGNADDAFIVHHFAEQAGRLFTDRIVVFDPKAAGTRVLVVVDDANVAFNGGLFNEQRVITLKGYVKRPDHEPVRLEATYTLDESLPIMGGVSLAAGWAFTVVSVVSGIFGVPYVPLVSYVLGEQLRGNYGQIKSNAQQTVIDKVASGAVTQFLNAAWEKIDEPSISEADAALNEAKRVSQERAEEERAATDKLTQVREDAAKSVQAVTDAEDKAAEQAKALEAAEEEKVAEDKNKQEKLDRQQARDDKEAENPTVRPKKAGKAKK